MTTKKIIYCISGLGADEKVFDNLHINGHELRYIPWLKPKPKETIQAYAKRMAEGISEASPILLGVSFGGMIGIEIAKQINIDRLFLISSIKSGSEMPKWMKMVASLKLHKIIPIRSNRLTEKIDNDRLGVSTKEEKEMVRNYRQKVDPIYLNWAVNEVITWRNDWQPERVVHIHGDKDKIFPIKKIKATHIIKEGTHMIIFNRADEIGKVVEEELKKTVS